MCLYEKEKASSAGFSRGASLTRLCWSRENPPEVPQLDCRRSRGVPRVREQGSGAQVEPLETLYPGPSHIPQGIRVPGPRHSVQQNPGDTQHLAALGIQQGLHKCCTDTGRKEPGPPVLTWLLNDSMHGLKQGGSPLGPWCPPPSSEETYWVAALPAQGFVTLEVTS